MSTATATSPNAQLADPVAEVARRIEALTLQGLSQGAAHKRVMKDAALRHRYVIAVNLKHGSVHGGVQYARRIG